MKLAVCSAALCLTLVTIAFAFSPSRAGVDGALQTEDPRRAELYNCWYANREKNPSTAYDCGKQFLAQYGSANDVYATAVGKFVWEYDNPNRVKFEGLFRQLETGAEGNEVVLLAKVFTTGQQLLDRQPDDLTILIRLSHAGFIAQKRKLDTYSANSAKFADAAIKQIEAGQTPETSFSTYPQPYLPKTIWIPFENRDDALAHLYYTLGFIQQAKSPELATASFYRALQLESGLKKDPLIQALMAIAYDSSAWEKASQKYRLMDNAPQPDREAALQTLFAITDRLMGYYARAVALSGGDVLYKQAKETASARLEVLYKFRHENSLAGLPEFVRAVVAEPLPDPAAPLTAAPAGP
ncbi:MAG: hypothetical protein ABIP75_10015 [Pyrinomonadaceae bacterium]